jgi:hypothetical protein
VRTRLALRLRVHCPVSPDTLAALARGEVDALASDPTAGPLLAVLRADPALGDFGLYRSVFAIEAGLEGFTPASEAEPAFGAPGEPALAPAVVVTSYIEAATPADAIDRALQALLDVHPWQTPVIELSDPVRLVLR